MVSSILPKIERKQFHLRYHSSKVEFFRSFFGRIEEIINCFRDLLTFSNFSHTKVFGAKKSEHGLFSTI